MASPDGVSPLQLVQFPFGGGIDESLRDELVEPGVGWAVMENGRQDHRGGYSTRNGFTALASGIIDGTSPTAGYKLFADRETVVRICDGTVQVYDSVTATWKSLGRVPDCSAREIDLPTPGRSSTIEDVEHCNGYICTAWNVSEGLSNYALYAVVNATTFATVRPPEQLTASYKVRQVLVGSYGNLFVAVFADVLLGRINVLYLDTTSAATITTGWVVVGSFVTDYWSQLAIQSLTNRIAVFYVNSSAGTDQATVFTVDITGVLVTQTIPTSSVTPYALDVVGSTADTLWLAWIETLDVRVMGLNATTLATTSAVATMFTCTASPSNLLLAKSATAGHGRVLIADSGTTVKMRARSFLVSAGTTTGDGAASVIPGAAPMGRPFVYGGRYYVPVYGGSLANVQKMCAIVDFTETTATTVRPIANLVPGLAAPSTYGQSKTIAIADATKLYFALGITRSGVASASALFELDFASMSRWSPVAVGNSTYLSGGILSCYDGTQVVEANFLVRPSTPTAATSGTGITATAGWRYLCVYEAIDGDGNWCVSGLSEPSASTGSVANKTVTVTTVPLSVSLRVSSVNAQSASTRVAFYRTLDGGVAPYYRLGTSLNDTSATTVTYADLIPDATLAAASKLYSQPGVNGTAQDHRAPPPFSCLVDYNGMLVGASGSDVFFSGQIVSGEGVWFNPIFQVPVPGEGDITALAVMDGTLFVFKRRGVYAINGDPPSDNAASGGLGMPRRLSVDVGASSHVTCTTASGVFFVSDRGVEILTRAQSVDWIGERVQDTFALYPNITSMTVDPGSCTVLVEASATETAGVATGNGRTFVYDLSLNAWTSTDRRTNSAGTADVPSQSACMLYTGTAWRYSWLGTNGVVYNEDTTHLDATSHWIAKRAVSANVKVAGPQGHQHVNKALLLAKKHTAHDVSLSFAYDYSSTYQTARLYTATQLGTLTAAIPNMQLEHTMHDDARCQAVRIQIVDATPSTGEAVGTGQAGTWIALAFETVPQQGAFALPDEAR